MTSDTVLEEVERQAFARGKERFAFGATLYDKVRTSWERLCTDPGGDEVGLCIGRYGRRARGQARPPSRVGFSRPRWPCISPPWVWLELGEQVRHMGWDGFTS